MSYHMEEFFQIATVRVMDGRSTFHTYRRCPQCHKDMLSNGKGMFLCDYCGYKDNKDVSKDCELYGWHGDSRHALQPLDFRSNRSKL